MIFDRKWTPIKKVNYLLKYFNGYKEITKEHENYILNKTKCVPIAANMAIREDSHKKSVSFSGRTTKVLPSLHKWLSGPCHFFLSYYSLKRILTIFSFSSQQLSAQWSGGFTLLTPLVVRPLQKPLFICVFSLNEYIILCYFFQI